MKTLPALMLALSAAWPVRALDGACEAFVAAAEKGVEQPSRQSVSELDGMRLESIIVDGKSYSAIGGKWKLMGIDLKAAERKLNAEIRSGVIRLDACKRLPATRIDGMAMTVIEYRLTMPGAPPASATAYIGNDGLIHALSADDTKVRYRYSGVRAPQL